LLTPLQLDTLSLLTTKNIITQHSLVKAPKRNRAIVCISVVIVDQPFDQIGSGYLVTIGYQANSQTMIKRYIVLIL
jgi:hypothetical protein